jgi:signal transduction histidine kinase
LFLGSSNRGLFVLTPHQFKTYTATLQENVFYGQVEYDHNRIFSSRGILLDLASNNTVVKPGFGTIRNDGYDLLADSHFIYTKSNFCIYQFNAKTLKLNDSTELPHPVSIIANGSNGEIWIGLLSGDVYRLARSSHLTPEHIATVQGKITYIVRTDGGIMYVGSDKGLYRIFQNNRNVETIAGLQGKEIRSILISAENEVWATTYGDGFFLVRNHAVTHFPLDQDKYLAVAHCIIADKNGFFWIPTNKGLFQVAKKALLAYAKDSMREMYYHYYDKTAGFNTNEFNGGCQPCALALSNGYVSMPSLNGLVVFNPDSMRYNIPDKNLFVDQIKLDNQPITEWKLRALSRHFSQLTLHVSSPFAGNPKNLQFRYAMVANGHQPVWADVPASGDIFFSTMSPGKYTLIVRKLNGFDTDDYYEKRIPVVVAPAWYNTRWAYAGGLVLLGLCCWIFIRIRLGYIHGRNRLLEQAVDDKTRELQFQTSIQEKIIRSVSHDIQTPLQYQRLLAEKLYHAIPAFSNGSLNTQAKALNDSTHRLYYMVDNLLTFLKAQMAREPLDHVKVDLYKIAEEKRMIFTDISAEKDTVLLNNVPLRCYVEGNDQLLSVILHNLVDNAVKVTRNGRINIRAKVINEQVVLNIEDTGPGLPITLQDRINSRGTSKSSDSPDAHFDHNSGIGLLMVKELSLLLGIEMKVTAEPGNGTLYTISLKAYPDPEIQMNAGF